MTYDDWKADVANREGSAPQDDPMTLEESVDALRCELCGEPCAGEDGTPVTLPGAGGTVMACPVCVALSADYCDRVFAADDGERPWSMTSFVEANGNDPDLPDHIAALKSLRVGESCTLGGGAVGTTTITRMS